MSENMETENIESEEIPVPETAEEPPAKKSKIAEEALKKIEEERKRKEQEKIEAEERAKNAKKAELEKFWKVVKDDPTDFTGWTHLLQYVDNKCELEVGREVFNTFLDRYPYCYGYWKKYADFEKRNGTPERVYEVFEEGVRAIPLSVDLWIHYLAHVKVVSKDEPETVRALYDKAMGSCGREWKSDKVWDNYVKWEQEAGNDQGVYKLFQRILTTPTNGINKNLDNFEAWLKTKSPKDLLETSEFLSMRKEALKSSDGETLDEESGAAPGENADDDMLGAEETKKIREMMVARMRDLMKPTEARIALRSKYEEGIKRPYFHVKPLERGQLKNWNEYLDFMTTEMSKEGGDMTEVEILYERALIACALYEEFWMNYIKWWGDREGDNSDKIRDIYRRACSFHLKEKVDIHIHWASYEEKLQNFEAAASVLETIEKSHPQLISLVMARINLERRRGNHDRVSGLFRDLIKGSNSKAVSCELSIKFARYLRLHLADNAQARQVLDLALETDAANPKLYLQQLDLLINTSPMDVAAITEVFEKALAQDFADKQKLLFSQRKVEFLGDFGTDLAKIEDTKHEHNKLVAAVKEKEEAALAKSKSEEKERTPTNGSSATTYAPVQNSNAYSAQQAAAYSNYGARYNNYQAGGGGGYGQWQGGQQGQGY